MDTPLSSAEGPDIASDSHTAATASVAIDYWWASLDHIARALRPFSDVADRYGVRRRLDQSGALTAPPERAIPWVVVPADHHRTLRPVAAHAICTLAAFDHFRVSFPRHASPFATSDQVPGNPVLHPPLVKRRRFRRSYLVSISRALHYRETSITSPLIAHRLSTGSAVSNSPATHRWSEGSHLTPFRYGETSR